AGAMKNVIAIAAGACQGLGLGSNPLAALITRGLAEMMRLAAALGARRETLGGLAGLGDLVLTCTGAEAATGTWESNWEKDARLPRFLRACAWLPRASTPWHRCSSWPANTGLSCPSRSRWTLFCTAESRQRMPFAKSWIGRSSANKRTKGVVKGHFAGGSTKVLVAVARRAVVVVPPRLRSAT